MEKESRPENEIRCPSCNSKDIVDGALMDDGFIEKLKVCNNCGDYWRARK